MDGLSDVQTTLLNNATTTVEQINNDLKELYGYNSNIYESVVRGINASELKDQRDELIAKLSEKVNLSVHVNETGAAIVNIGGVQAADQYGYNQFEMKIVDGKLRMVSKDDSHSTAVINNGELFAITDLYSNKIPQYKSSFENLQSVFVSKVNELHMSGSTLIQGGTQRQTFHSLVNQILTGTQSTLFLTEKLK